MLRSLLPGFWRLVMSSASPCKFSGKWCPGEDSTFSHNIVTLRTKCPQICPQVAAIDSVRVVIGIVED